MGKHHIHEMRRSGSAYKCSSCAFRCTGKALAEVNKNPQAHRVVKANEKQEVYGR